MEPVADARHADRAEVRELTYKYNPGSRKVGFMVIGVYDLRASNTGPPGCQKSASITTVKVLDFTEQNRHLNLALKTHFGGTELVSKLPVSKALQTEQIS